MTHVGIMARKTGNRHLSTLFVGSLVIGPHPLPLLCNLVSGGSDILD